MVPTRRPQEALDFALTALQIIKQINSINKHIAKKSSARESNFSSHGLRIKNHPSPADKPAGSFF
jgi:hypothetical protein